MCFGFRSSILLMKSPFSRQPSQLSSQSLRIFFRSRTLSFLRSTLLRSICFSENSRAFINMRSDIITRLVIKTYHNVARKPACPFSSAFRISCRKAFPTTSAWTSRPRSRWQHLQYLRDNNTAEDKFT
jgi:hypothetical protein